MVMPDSANWRLKGAGRKFKYIPWKEIAKNRMNQVFFINLMTNFIKGENKGSNEKIG